MLKLKLDLLQKNNCPVTLNYKYYLADLCSKLVNESQETLKKLNKLSSATDELESILKFSPFYCSSYELIQNKIIFRGDISWNIYCTIPELTLYIAQKLFWSEVIKVGREVFEIAGMELIEMKNPQDELSKMAFQKNPDNMFFIDSRMNELSGSVLELENIG